MKITGILVCTGLFGVTSAATAATVQATSANFTSVFKSARAGDRIILSGSFAAFTLADQSWSSPVQIDATAARFTDSLTIRNVSGLAFTGGTFGSTTAAMRQGRAVVIYGGSGISFTTPTVNGNRTGVGIAFNGSRDISVINGKFSTLKVGLTLIGVTGGNLTGNKSLAAASDGMNIVDSHFVTASKNTCSGTVISVGAHPDCIQLWSLAGNPVQSDISLLDNVATGATQGFTSFDSSRGGGLRIIMRRNRVDTSYPQGIACYGCVDSIFTDNVLTTQPGAAYRTSMNIVGGSNNLIANNSIGPRTVPIGSFIGNTALRAVGFEAEIVADAVAAVPEPGVWAQLILGLAGIGTLMRRRRQLA